MVWELFVKNRTFFCMLKRSFNIQDFRTCVTDRRTKEAHLPAKALIRDLSNNFDELSASHSSLVMLLMLFWPALSQCMPECKVSTSVIVEASVIHKDPEVREINKHLTNHPQK